ncbi:response regulator [Micromonospora endolithica]|uniref:DNA-binding response regulator n=1 Tax=Micromonospora endolithica TaxID=230091 RepID=A0A3A9YUL5_9ACTN|nr:response regulator transcription factor [Micromonospora endolithica]RKN39665.1 DNA-binding response regulator [Micromonospora endolithica]TWJ22190.1 LuxR family two component transcriptional regulator [Micromonospora endolithica]
MSRLRVLLVDDDDLMRAGLRAVLSVDDGIDVVGEASDGREAVELTRALDPDVVLMDVRMPRMDGVAATREIVTGRYRAKVLILTTFEDDEYVFGALRAGASGFVLKRIRPEQLIAGIHTVADGEALLAPSVTRTVIGRMVRHDAEPADPARDRRLRELTPRERDVLDLVSRGLSNAEIAARLVIEESTVKTHVKRILAKTGLRDRVQAVVLAYESGLVRPGQQGPR